MLLSRPLKGDDTQVRAARFVHESLELFDIRNFVSDAPDKELTIVRRTEFEAPRLDVEIVAAHKASKRRYGSPRTHRALRQRGVRLGKKRVERLMRGAGLVTKQKRRFRRTTDSAHDRPIAPNLLARNFEPHAPNVAWAGDVTYIATDEGWAYLAVLLDLFSRRVVGWAMSAINDSELALAALRSALRRRRVPLVGLVQHTYRGSPYASADYRAALTEYGMIASMSRKADCWDNAVSESFFATLRAELVDDEPPDTRSRRGDHRLVHRGLL